VDVATTTLTVMVLVLYWVEVVVLVAAKVMKGSSKAAVKVGKRILEMRHWVSRFVLSQFFLIFQYCPVVGVKVLQNDRDWNQCGRQLLF